MTYRPDVEAGVGAVPPPGCPAHAGHAGFGAPTRPVAQGLPLYGPDFAADPHALLRAAARSTGPSPRSSCPPASRPRSSPSYALALEVLRDTERFAKDPRRWHALADGAIPPDSPVVPMMMYRPNALFTDGEEHARLRGAITDSLTRLDPYALSGYVERSADTPHRPVRRRGRGGPARRLRARPAAARLQPALRLPRRARATRWSGHGATLRQRRGRGGGQRGTRWTTCRAWSPLKRERARGRHHLLADGPPRPADRRGDDAAAHAAPGRRNRARAEPDLPTRCACCCPTTGSPVISPAAACPSRTPSTRSCGPTRRWRTTGPTYPLRDLDLAGRRVPPGRADPHQLRRRQHRPRADLRRPVRQPRPPRLERGAAHLPGRRARPG